MQAITGNKSFKLFFTFNMTFVLIELMTEKFEKIKKETNDASIYKIVDPIFIQNFGIIKYDFIVILSLYF